MIIDLNGLIITYLLLLVSPMLLALVIVLFCKDFEISIAKVKLICYNMYRKEKK